MYPALWRVIGYVHCSSQRILSMEKFSNPVLSARISYWHCTYSVKTFICMHELTRYVHASWRKLPQVELPMTKVTTQQCSEGVVFLYLDWWFAGDVWHEEVHRKVFTVEVLVDFISYCLWHHVTVDVHVILQQHSDSFHSTNVAMNK